VLQPQKSAAATSYGFGAR